MDGAELARGAVVVAFDGSPAAGQAVSWAAAAAASRGVDLVVVTTTWWPAALDPAAGLVRLVPESCVDEVVARATAGRPSLNVFGHVADGASELLVCADELDAALIVVAAGPGVPVRGLVRAAGRPLAFAGGPREPEPDGPVVVEIDSRQVRPAELALAFGLARSAGVGLHVLHTTSARRLIAPRPPAADLAAFAVAELGDWLVSYPDVRVTYELTSAARTRTLTRRAHTAPLLLVGARGRTRR
ncbi:universal stress protein [Amycolatopsis sp. FDAARGOS 1241]|uniref:universal stress protein n=1 Tax=Amycolatopsis sp. FDAARGOS 1241 TaxID=2778070 RepID=UPI0019517EC1|nr:universal stress protein [Amycolatopsis sp. FDAARGOS 1241]QRP48457.1 universal stress protein [Amycolatopsis sp. FDAARGOS 1241]